MINETYVDFAPSGWLENPHVQSVLASVPPRRTLVRQRAKQFMALSEDWILDCGEGVRLLGHHTAPGVNDNGRTVVMIHGWEGNADSTYNLSLALRLHAEGYGVFRLNLRDHGKSHHLNEAMFHSCRLDEVVGAVKCLSTKLPARSLALVGYSLGGNFSLRVAAKAPQAELSLEQVVAVCPVLSPVATMAALDAGQFFYRRHFINKWRRSLDKKHRAFPELYNFNNLTHFSNLTDMTDYFVTRYTEYADLRTYLDGYALTGERLQHLTVLSSVLLADDDPVIPVAGLKDVAVTPALKIFRSRVGGHCGFLQDAKLRSWLDGFVSDRLAKNAV